MPPDGLTEKVYVELVRSLYANMLPSKIMLAITIVYVSLIAFDGADTPLRAIGVAAVVSCTVRIGIASWFRGRAMTAALDSMAARRLERAFAWPYYGFAAIFGLFGGYVFAAMDAAPQMLTICVLVGFCAGVATGTGLRPRVAVPIMLMAIGPSIAIAACTLEALHLGMSAIASAFLAGGIQTVLAQHRVARTEIGKRLTSVSLARRDGLTALPNRLALREYFDENALLLGPGSALAVHYLDLDGFKPVNDRFGHAAGDTVLASVAERLRAAVRSGDIVARLGGDEFGIVQFGLSRQEEAELLARRLCAAIAEPFRVEGQAVAISASVGTIVSVGSGSDLEALLRQADTRLYEAKRKRSVSVAS